MGREIVYNNEIRKNKKFQKEMSLDQNFSEKWKWQNMVFEKNILSTIKDAKLHIKPSKRLINNFGFKIV